MHDYAVKVIHSKFNYSYSYKLLYSKRNKLQLAYYSYLYTKVTRYFFITC